MEDWETECSKCGELIDVKNRTCGYCGEPQFRPCPLCPAKDAELERLRTYTERLRGATSATSNLDYIVSLEKECDRLRAIEARMTEEGVAKFMNDNYYGGLTERVNANTSRWATPSDIAKAVLRYLRGEGRDE